MATITAQSPSAASYRRRELLHWVAVVMPLQAA